MLEYIKKLYECNNQSLLKALIADNVESFIYDLLISKFNQPFGSATKELAKKLYEEEIQQWVVQMKLFEPLLR